MTTTWKLKRVLFDKGTIGVLALDDGYTCVTLEPKKLTSGKPRAIPAGTYKLKWHQSPTFGKVIEIDGIPDFDLVYFHAGNFVEDTKACVLPGKTFDKTSFSVTASRKALAPIVERFAYHDAQKNTVLLTVED